MSVKCYEKFKSNNTGDGLRATTSISKGSSIFVEEPIFFALDYKEKQSYCNACLKKTKLLACSRCRQVYYCSKQCQVTNWSLHKLECRYLQELQKLDKDIVENIGTNISQVSVFGPVGLKMLISDALQKDKDHLRSISDLTVCQNQTVEGNTLIEIFYEAISKFVPKKFVFPKNYSISKYIKAFLENSFYIGNEEENIGLGLYLNSSLFNHACLPNCFCIFEGKKIRFIAKRDIAKGEELTIAYMDLMASCTEERKIEIKSKQGFDCWCDTCNRKLHDDLKLKCQDGSTLSEKKRLSLQQEHYKLTQVYGLVQSGEVSITAGMRLCREFLLRNGLAKCNWYHVSVSTILADYYKAQGDFDTCLLLRLQSLKFLKLFIPDSIKLGSELFSLSRMYAMRCDFPNSLKYLAESKKCIQFGYVKLKSTENLCGQKHTYRYEQIDFFSEFENRFIECV